MIKRDQIPERFKETIDRQLDKFKNRIFPSDVSQIPDRDDIPGEGSQNWLRIPDVICVFVDMKNSTQLSAARHAGSTARIYRLFTGTAVRLFRQFNASYIDVKGDGVFALFNSDQTHSALAAAVTFKTFVKEEFRPKVINKTNSRIESGVHIGIHRSTLLVSRVGLRRSSSRHDMHNEVWAGNAVNMAAKLSGLSDNDEIHVSKKYFDTLKCQKALYSCTCGSAEPGMLWREVDLSSKDRFNFDKGYVLESAWCSKHGAAYLDEIIAADSA